MPSLLVPIILTFPKLFTPLPFGEGSGERLVWSGERLPRVFEEAAIYLLSPCTIDITRSQLPPQIFTISCSLYLRRSR